MRRIDHLVIHCSGNFQGQDVKAQSIIDFHKAPVSKGGRGWRVGGYHYIIELNGNVVATYPHSQVTNGARGINTNSIHICYVGGLEAKREGVNYANHKIKDTRTAEQRTSMLQLLINLRKMYPLAKISGHRDWANKGCPSFDAKNEFKLI
jgi:N-acetylmuramoyl-L-alanine amidase